MLLDDRSQLIGQCHDGRILPSDAFILDQTEGQLMRQHLFLQEGGVKRRCIQILKGRDLELQFRRKCLGQGHSASGRQRVDLILCRGVLIDQHMGISTYRRRIALRQRYLR